MASYEYDPKNPLAFPPKDARVDLTTSAGREEAKTQKAILTVLDHTGVRDGADLDALEQIIRRARDDKVRLRAIKIMMDGRFRAAELMCVKEQKLKELGLTPNGVLTGGGNTFNLNILGDETLKKLAGGVSLEEVLREERAARKVVEPILEAPPPSSVEVTLGLEPSSDED